MIDYAEGLDVHGHVEEVGGWRIFRRCVELPVVTSQGESEEEVLSNIREAIGLVLEEPKPRSSPETRQVELKTVTV
ncbi:MAG: type II toxin-antitoxin system HicB family antitoxin [Candidatus Bathyarchaeia archaeon]